MRRLGVRVLLALLFTAFSQYGNAKHSRSSVLLCGTHFPPFITFNTSTNRVSGTAIDYVEEIFSSMDLSTTIKIVPWSRCQFMLMQGTADAALLVRKAKNREEFLEFSHPILSREIFLFHRADRFDSSFQWDSIQDLGDYSFASGRGFLVTDELLDLGMNIVGQTETQVQVYDMVAHYRADFFTDFNDSFQELLSENPRFKRLFRRVEKPFKSATYSIGISKNSELYDKTNEINSIILQIGPMQ